MLDSSVGLCGSSSPAGRKGASCSRNSGSASRGISESGVSTLDRSTAEMNNELTNCHWSRSYLHEDKQRSLEYDSEGGGITGKSLSPQSLIAKLEFFLCMKRSGLGALIKILVSLRMFWTKHHYFHLSKHLLGCNERNN